MKFKATDYQVKTMCALAAQASIPMGMGFMHYDPSTVFSADDFGIAIDNSGAFINYCQGRMVKLCIWRAGDGAWEAADAIRSDYQSWRCKYPSYVELALAAGAEIVP